MTRLEHFDDCVKQYHKTGDYTPLSLDFGNTSENGTRFTGLQALGILFNQIPEEQKYEIVIDVYTNVKTSTKGLIKYLKAIKPLIPNNVTEPIKKHIDDNDNIIVYRGGVERKNPALSTSWTLSKEKAEWFAKRFLFLDNSVVYRGIIKANKIIAYTNGREEQEIIQYNDVKKIEIVERYEKT